MLTAREREVLQLIARGYRYKEIAARLHLSVKTVETHVSAVLRKLQLSNRNELTRWAAERRLKAGWCTIRVDGRAGRQGRAEAAIEARKNWHGARAGGDRRFVERIERRLEERDDQREQAIKRKRDLQRDKVLGAMGISISAARDQALREPRGSWPCAPRWPWSRSRRPVTPSSDREPGTRLATRTSATPLIPARVEKSR